MMTPFEMMVLRRADIRHEAVKLFAQSRAFGRKGFGRIQHLLGGRPGFRRAAIDLQDIGGGFMGALRDVLNAARDFLGRRVCCSTALAIVEAMLEIWAMVP